MEYTLLLVAIILVLWFVFKKFGGGEEDESIRSSGRRSRAEAPAATKPKEQATGQREPRDYLTMASGYLETPRPIPELLLENQEEVFFNLLKFIETGGTYQRKYAAYALGQIGDPRYLEALEKAARTERVQGVKDAMNASLVALREAPATQGYTEMDRRQLIESVYSSSPSLNALIEEMRSKISR